METELARGRAVNEDSTSNLMPRDKVESKAESKAGQNFTGQNEEKWKVFLNPPKIKAEVFTHNIFSDEQKVNAKGIYKRRLDNYI